ncbi:MAG: cytochrome d ubiquinol oxidase subunit II [Micrococcales bacterium]|nr:cytochrome d ubiquinol oxidase subunit II [Micrococcales bacterium]
MLTNILALASAAPVNPEVTEATAQGLVGLLHNMTASPTGLQVLWFVLIAVLWTGYLVLEGFDFGVGMLLPFVGKKNEERRATLSTIGPLWDGNEVWLLTAGGATFAAFPEWYATLFPAAYLPLLLILFGLIIRAVAFEYRGKVNSDSWRKMWDWCIIVGSWVPAVLWGVAFANLVAGVKAAVDIAQVGPSKIIYDGNFFDLVIGHQGFLLLGGATTAALFLAHGAIFLSLKTDGVVRERAEKLAPRLTIVATVIAAAWVVWLGLKFSGGNHPTILVWIGIAVAALALVLAILTSLRKMFGPAFTSTTVAITAAVVVIFAAMFPNVINGSQVTLRNGVVTEFNAKTGEQDVVVNLADPIVGYFVLSNVDDSGLPVATGGQAPTVVDVVHATIGLVAASEPTAADLPEASEEGTWLTNAILADVLTGTYPAAGVISQADTKAAVDLTFGVYDQAVEDGIIRVADFGKDVEPTDEAVALTAAVVAAVQDGSLLEGKDVAGVVSLENVVTVVKITLARNGLPSDDATVTAVVTAIANGDATVAGLSIADVVVPEVEKTVTACLGMLEQAVTAVIATLPTTLQVVADQIADNKDLTFYDGMDLTAIITGSAWDNDKGLANLNERIENANGALGALYAVGILEGEFTPMETFADGAVITGQTMMTSSSSPLTLELMTWVAVIMVPIVLGYQAWSIWVFRKRISAERIPAENGLEPAKK